MCKHLAAKGPSAHGRSIVGLRFGNSRSGLGNITHVDLAIPLKRTPGVKGIQFIVQTQQGF